jgi:hypothetical protein
MVTFWLSHQEKHYQDSALPQTQFKTSPICVRNTASNLKSLENDSSQFENSQTCFDSQLPAWPLIPTDHPGLGD